jgi:hypothetical protein
MKHALLIMHPPYATQIINQLDGSIMLKFEVERKQSLVDMLAKAIMELNEIKVPVPPTPEPIHLKGRVVPLKEALTKVVPDDGPLPQMRPVMIPGPTQEQIDEQEKFKRDGESPPSTEAS